MSPLEQDKSPTSSDVELARNLFRAKRLELAEKIEAGRAISVQTGELGEKMVKNKDLQSRTSDLALRRGATAQEIASSGDGQARQVTMLRKEDAGLSGQEADLRERIAVSMQKTRDADTALHLTLEISGQPATEQNIKKAHEILQKTGTLPEDFEFNIVKNIPGAKENGELLAKITKISCMKLFGSTKNVADETERKTIEALQTAAAERLITAWIREKGKLESTDSDHSEQHILGRPSNIDDIQLLIAQPWFPKFFTTISLYASVLDKNKTSLEIDQDEQHIGSTVFSVALDMGIRRLAEASEILGAKVEKWRDPNVLLTDEDSPMFLRSDGYPAHPDLWTSPTPEVLEKFQLPSKKNNQNESRPETPDTILA